MSNQIVVVGSCMVDFFCYTPNLPKAGETVLGKKFTTGNGGKGANQCVAAAKLGGKTALVARLGDDSWGSDYLSSLKQHQIDTTHVQITPNTASGIAQITVDDSGQNQIVIVRGANDKLKPDDVLKAKELISKAKVVICQLETNVDVALYALKLAQDSEGVSILNGAPAIPVSGMLFSLPTIFCVNETEAEIFTDLKVSNVSEGKIAVTTLITKGCNIVILTMGAQGALLGIKNIEDVVHVTSKKITSVDSTGAGDAFIGALAYLIAEHPNLGYEKCIKIACDLAAESVTKLGTQISFADKDFLQKYLQANNL